ncbi:MAG: hypothetical protein GY814_19550 [Gammaproteobacteria bacterium]|nr:hypothetical protein [Gammaproteobacteria bacterium]
MKIFITVNIIATLIYICVLIIATIGVSAGLIGYLKTKLHWVERVVLLTAPVMVIGTVTELIYLGAALLLAVIALNFQRCRQHV